VTGSRELEQPLRVLQALPPGPLALLHSCGAGRAILCDEPVETLSLAPGECDGAFGRLDAFLARHRARRSVGWLGYDLRDAVEAVPPRIAEDFPVPALSFTAYARVREWDGPAVPAPPATEPAIELVAAASRAEYERRVAAVIEHVRAGDVFQANLAQPFTARCAAPPRALFWRLCAVSPAPFAAYLEDGRGLAVLSSSPEEFLHVRDRSVRSRPIKGTRPRAAAPERDRALLAELLASEKDQAELAMIVDLMRNDLGKLAVPGSVRVGPFPEHASYAQVHHLFATVTARLREDASPGALLAATFPPGSVTGAPKLRCMQILEALEWARRGVSFGAIGWIGPGDALHLNVAIRTMVWRDGVLRFHAGGGVTAMSDPAAEYRETLAKAGGMLAALRWQR
jgi:para-aminobenzoate synthetase component 1